MGVLRSTMRPLAALGARSSRDTGYVRLGVCSAACYCADSGLPFHHHDGLLRQSRMSFARPASTQGQQNKPGSPETPFGWFPFAKCVHLAAATLGARGWAALLLLLLMLLLLLLFFSVFFSPHHGWVDRLGQQNRLVFVSDSDGRSTGALGNSKGVPVSLFCRVVKH